MHSQLLAEVESLCTPFYESLDFAHNLQHGRRVVAFAKELQAREGGDPFLSEAGAWLHQFHDHLSELDELLIKTGATTEQKEQLREVVRLCRPHLISCDAPLEAQIVFDADALDLMGPTGILREVLCNAVARNLSPEEAVERARETQELFRSKLNTETAQALASGRLDPSPQFWSALDDWANLEDLFSFDNS